MRLQRLARRKNSVGSAPMTRKLASTRVGSVGVIAPAAERPACHADETAVPRSPRERVYRSARRAVQILYTTSTCNGRPDVARTMLNQDTKAPRRAARAEGRPRSRTDEWSQEPWW